MKKRRTPCKVVGCEAVATGAGLTVARVQGLGVAGLIVSLYSAWALSRGAAFADPTDLGVRAHLANTWGGVADPKFLELLQRARDVADARASCTALVLGFSTSLVDGFDVAMPRGYGVGLGIAAVALLRFAYVPRRRRAAEIDAMTGFVSAAINYARWTESAKSVRRLLEARRWPASDIERVFSRRVPTGAWWSGGW